MNYETIRLLAAQMGVPADDILAADRELCEHEANLPSETHVFMEQAAHAMKTILEDDTLSLGVRLGFTISTSAIAVARANNLPLSEIFLNLAASSAASERMAEIQEVLGNLFGFPVARPTEKPANCEECGSEPTWCIHHEAWECSDPDCDVRELPEA